MLEEKVGGREVVRRIGVELHRVGIGLDRQLVFLERWLYYFGACISGLLRCLVGCLLGKRVKGGEVLKLERGLS